MLRNKAPWLPGVFLGVLLFGTAAAISPVYAEQPAAAASAAGIDHVEVRVNGMACPFCAYGIEKKLRALPGARNVKVDLEGGRATFEAPAGAVTEQQIRQAIKEAGFTPGAINVTHGA
jgi:copper chaperone CopZ